MIVIIDYNMGNLFSVKKALNHIGCNVVVSKDHKVLAEASKIILPGVGNFDNGMDQLNRLGLTDLLNELVLEKNIIILGICLGMQMFTDYSEEGDKNGLGWIKAKTRRFADNDKLRIPHMGWNTLNNGFEQPILKGISKTSFFYFAHSYFVEKPDNCDFTVESDYSTNFTSIFKFKNIYGVQFHPEKSHHQGIRILKNFVDI